MPPQTSSLCGVSVKNTKVLTCFLVTAQSPPFKMKAMRKVSTASSSHYQLRNVKTCCGIKCVG